MGRNSMLNNFINSVVTDNNKQNIPSGTFSSSLSNTKVGGNGSCGSIVTAGGAAKKRAYKRKTPASKGGAINVSPFFSSLVLLGLRLATGEMKKKRGRKSGGAPAPMKIPSLEHFISENVKFSSGTPFEFKQSPVVGGKKVKRRGGNSGGVPAYLNMSNTPFNDMEVNKFVDQPTILDEQQDGGKRRSKSPKRRGRKVKRGGEAHSSMNF